MTKIKICGLFRELDAEYVNEALPDYIGFVFAKSRRKVTYAQAEIIRKLLDKRIKTVGVFTDADIDEVASLSGSNIIDLIQLHGNEDAAYIEKLRSKASSPVIKAVRVQNAAQIIEAQKLPCDYILLDAWQQNCGGGSGISFDWALIPELTKPFFIAGGIGAANIQEALKLQPYCIDISSGAESNGIKDKYKIIELVKIVRSYGK